MTSPPPHKKINKIIIIINIKKAAGLEEYIKEEEEDHGVPITSSPAPAGGGSRLNGAAGYLEVEDGSPSVYIDVLPTPKDTYMDDGLLTTPMKAAGYVKNVPHSLRILLTREEH